MSRKQRGGRGLNPGPPDPGIRGVHHSVTHASQNLAKPWGFFGLFVFVFVFDIFPGWKFCKIGGPRNLDIGALNFFKKTCEWNTPMAILVLENSFWGLDEARKKAAKNVVIDG